MMLNITILLIWSMLRKLLRHIVLPICRMLRCIIFLIQPHFTSDEGSDLRLNIVRQFSLSLSLSSSFSLTHPWLYIKPICSGYYHPVRFERDYIGLVKGVVVPNVGLPGDFLLCGQIGFMPSSLYTLSPLLYSILIFIPTIFISTEYKMEQFEDKWFQHRCKGRCPS